MKVRRVVKTLSASLLHSTGLAVSVNGREPVVIAYHRVVGEFDPNIGYMPSMMISSKMLERQLDWLGSRYQIVSLDELGSRLKSGQETAERLAAVTFDDGYRDFYENAFPVLRRKGLPSAVFVVTDLVGTAELHLHDKLYLLVSRALSESREHLYRLLDTFEIRSPGLQKRNGATPFQIMRSLFTTVPQRHLLPLVHALERQFAIEEGIRRELLPLSWEMLLKMQGQGVTIGSHTCTHILFTNEDPTTVSEETKYSRRELERRLGVAIRHFAYPDGRFSASGVEAVAAAGYDFAYTCCNHRHLSYPLLTIPRIGFWEDSCKDAFGQFSGRIMDCQLSRIFRWRNRCHDDHGGIRR